MVTEISKLRHHKLSFRQYHNARFKGGEKYLELSYKHFYVNGLNFCFGAAISVYMSHFIF